MNHIPSKSISKSVLLATPLFILILAVLHSSSQVSYLFVLDFVNNVAGSQDIMFLPSMVKEIPEHTFDNDLILNSYEIYPDEEINVNDNSLPLINITQIQKWAQSKQLVRGVSNRWIIPMKTQKTDTLLMVMNISKQKTLGIADNIYLNNLTQNQVIVEESLLSRLDKKVSGVLNINLQIKNILEGLKLFEKFQEGTSKKQFVTDNEEFSPQTLSSILYDTFDLGSQDISKQQFQTFIKIIYESDTSLNYIIADQFYPNGLYPSALHNVIIMEYNGFAKLLARWTIQTVLDTDKQYRKLIMQLIPQEFQQFYPKNQMIADVQEPYIKKGISESLLRNTALFQVCTLWHRSQIYLPTKGPIYNEFTNVLQSAPDSVQVIATYPFYYESLAIKFFFDSVIQIFQFVSFILYFYTMTLIIKQIYEQKQIEVGIWRTLGAGGLKPLQQNIQLQQVNIKNKGHKNLYSNNFNSERTIRQNLSHYYRILVKVGYIYYWLLSAVVSLTLYAFLKFFIYSQVQNILNQQTQMQPISNILILFTMIFFFTQGLCIFHIRQIYMNPLSETIKPVKRTFDVVKIRIIYMATFGISFQTLLIAVMLIYYGVVSYYWIPFAILDGNTNLQVTLSNSIFIFMIFGAIILLSVLQSRIQRGILSILFMLNSRLKTMKAILLKNIKAKQYKNIKMSIIIAIIFAFVLFFTAGIKIEIQIVQSFIERALGSNLVMQNYEKETFNTTKVNQYLDGVEGIQYSWLSRNLNRDNIQFIFISHIQNEQWNEPFKILTPNYLNSTFYQYYFPQQYLPDKDNYHELPNGVADGFDSIYTGQYGNESVGKYNPNDTLTDFDPNKINIQSPTSASDQTLKMAPNEQIIDIVVSYKLRDYLGINVGQMYKMKVKNTDTDTSFYIRSRITHSFKAGPGFDILPDFAFISPQQAEYLYSILDEKDKKVDENQKLFIKGDTNALKGVGAAIITMSPQHTQMFQISFVAHSFELLEKYLNAFIILITAIMSLLAVLFLFLYTIGKCREQAEMYKMLRAIGLSTFSIRLMIFIEILIRLIVSIANGIILGIVLSVGFSKQIEQFLMIKTPEIDLTIVLVIAVVLLIVFSITVIKSTSYLSKRTVAQTTKI